jgi:hypothetical protein
MPENIYTPLPEVCVVMDVISGVMPLVIPQSFSGSGAVKLWFLMEVAREPEFSDNSVIFYGGSRDV